MSDEALIAALSDPGIFPDRIRLMVMLAAFQGLRIHEIAKLHSDDFDLTSGTLLIEGKGGHIDERPLHPLIEEEARRQPAGFWFPTQRTTGGPISPQWASSLVARAFAKAGFDITAHGGRHRFATKLLRAGIDIRQVQYAMRHSSIQATSRYLAPDPEILGDAIAEALSDPREGRRRRPSKRKPNNANNNQADRKQQGSQRGVPESSNNDCVNDGG
jgi:integrase